VCLQQNGELERFRPYKEELMALNDELENKLHLKFVSFEIQGQFSTIQSIY